LAQANCWQWFQVVRSKPLSESASAESKLQVVIESSALSVLDLSEYCHRQAVSLDQIDGWRDAIISNSSNHFWT